MHIKSWPSSTDTTSRSAPESTQFIKKSKRTVVWLTTDLSDAYLSFTHETFATNTGDFHSKTYVAGAVGLADFAFHDAVNRCDANSR